MVTKYRYQDRESGINSFNFQPSKLKLLKNLESYMKFINNRLALYRRLYNLDSITCFGGKFEKIGEKFGEISSRAKKSELGFGTARKSC